MNFLEMKGGFDPYIIEEPSDFMVMIGKDKTNAPILKISVDHRVTREARIFIMKDRAAVEEALVLEHRRNMRGKVLQDARLTFLLSA